MFDGPDVMTEAWQDSLATRLRRIRMDVFGPDGIEYLAARLGIAPQTWRNIELISGLITPAQLVAFVELTGAAPMWLLRGEGSAYRRGCKPLRLR